ncbi:hypothetical protein ACFWZY_18175 [Streptomyces sp. NPDC058992]
MSPRRWDFISSNRADFGVKRICRALGVSGSGSGCTAYRLADPP